MTEQCEGRRDWVGDDQSARQSRSPSRKACLDERFDFLTNGFLDDGERVSTAMMALYKEVVLTSGSQSELKKRRITGKKACKEPAGVLPEAGMWSSVII